jgi:hypothetical protein
VSHVTIFTTGPNFRKVVVVIFWCGSKGSDQFCSAHKGASKKFHQVRIKEHLLRNSLNFLQEDGCLGGDILVQLQNATSFTNAQKR